MGIERIGAADDARLDAFREVTDPRSHPSPGELRGRRPARRRRPARPCSASPARPLPDRSGPGLPAGRGDPPARARRRAGRGLARDPRRAHRGPLPPGLSRRRRPPRGAERARAAGRRAAGPPPRPRGGDRSRQRGHPLSERPRVRGGWRAARPRRGAPALPQGPSDLARKHAPPALRLRRALARDAGRAGGAWVPSASP